MPVSTFCGGWLSGGKTNEQMNGNYAEVVTQTGVIPNGYNKLHLAPSLSLTTTGSEVVIAREINLMTQPTNKLMTGCSLWSKFLSQLPFECSVVYVAIFFWGRGAIVSSSNDILYTPIYKRKLVSQWCHQTELMKIRLKLMLFNHESV